jgi:hypothetical protein
MTSSAEVTKLLQDALDTQPTIIGQLNDYNLLALKEKLIDILQTISYDGADGFYHVIGVMQMELPTWQTTKAVHFPFPNVLASVTKILPKMQQ